MAAKVAATSGRAFSKAVTGGRNPDFYRNFVNDGQDKRLSADVFAGIVRALGRNPADYIVGMDQRFTLPNATVLTSTFAVLLASLEIDPYKDERAQKLAAQFPDALKSVADLQSRSIAASSAPPEEDALDAAAGSSPS